MWPCGSIAEFAELVSSRSLKRCTDRWSKKKKKSTPAGSRYLCLISPRVFWASTRWASACLKQRSRLLCAAEIGFTWAGDQIASADLVIKLNEERGESKKKRKKRKDPVVALILNLIKVPKEVKIQKSSVLAFVFLNSSLGWCVTLVRTVRAAACTSTVSVKHLLDVTWRSFRHLALHVFVSPFMYVCTSTVYIHVCRLWHGNLPVVLSVSA